jgi:hypothetical protein
MLEVVRGYQILRLAQNARDLNVPGYNTFPNIGNSPPSLVVKGI